MSLFTAIIQEMRIKQWTKNVLIYSALLFSGGFFVEKNFLITSMAFTAFCLASSGVYFFNDIFDVANDRSNPKKCHRPIAAGMISIKQSYICAVVLFILGLFLAYFTQIEWIEKAINYKDDLSLQAIDTCDIIQWAIPNCTKVGQYKMYGQIL